MRFTKKSGETDMMKMFSIVREFLEKYFKNVKNDRAYKPSFADNMMSLWYGLSEEERYKVLEFARKNDQISFERMLQNIDRDDEINEELERKEESDTFQEFAKRELGKKEK